MARQLAKLLLLLSSLLFLFVSILLPLTHASSDSSPEESIASQPRFATVDSSQILLYGSFSPTMSVGTFSLPALPYAYNALEPSISAQIMELHHSKHHQAYVTNLNNALKASAAAAATNDVPSQIALQAAIKFNGGGHINHSLFWENLCPASSPDADPKSAPTLTAQIIKTWGSLEAFKDAMGKALLSIQGSGWGWLVKDGHALRIVTTKDQDPVVGGEVPVFGIDMWEHAYYLQYLNGKAVYVENIWQVINWKTAERRFAGGRDDAFKVLKASI